MRQSEPRSQDLTFYCKVFLYILSISCKNKAIYEPNFFNPEHAYKGPLKNDVIANLAI